MRIRRITARGAARAVRRFRDGISDERQVGEAVAAILDDVRARGDEALFEATRRFDGVDLSPRAVKVGDREREEGWKSIGPGNRKAIRAAARAIREYHRRCLPRGWTARNTDGVTVGERFYPLRRAGLYVPGGRVPLVSTVLMTAIPAQAAGVPGIAVCTPPQADGSVAGGLLAAFYYLGLREVYRVGGAQAVGAMAFGTKTIPAVDLIAGPGNAYVTEAKRRLFGRVGVDLLPGPSEVMVIADGGADPARVAGDLLAQAEHGTGKEKLYLTVPDQTFWKAVRRELEAGTEGLANGKTVAGILADRLFAAVCEDEEAVVALANEIAPEHLELQVAPPAVRALTKRITTAGAILQGYETATALGDFVAGPSHTLPTDGTGRFSGGLQVGHFLRRSSLVRSTPAANRRALPAVEAFARMESLPAHADSLRRRVR